MVASRVAIFAPRALIRMPHFMSKKLFVLAALVAVAFTPFARSTQATSGNWDTLIASAAWSYDGYRVERLTYSADTVGPINMGNSVIVAEPADSCEASGCDLYDVSFLDSGMKFSLSDLPSDILDTHRFANNGERFVYVSQADWNGNHYAVNEVEPDGTSTALVEDVFFNGANEVDVLTDGDTYYFNAELDYNNSTNVSQAGVYVWDAPAKLATIIGDHWELRDESLEDAQDGVALVKMTFESGNKQLWYEDTHNYNHYGMTREAIPGTWVEPEADIYAAHFTEGQAIEFFMNYTRYTYDPETDSEPVKHDDQFLNWFRDASVGYQILDGRMAWVTPDDQLMVSETDGTVKTLGTAIGGQFLLESDRVFYATSTGGRQYDFDTETTTDLDFAVTDTNGDDVYVGLDSTDHVWYADLESGTAIELGYGNAPVLADDLHVYWKGEDGHFYEGTVSVASRVYAGTASAMKGPTGSTVYLVVDGVRYAFASEKAYFTWFDSWDAVESVSTTTLASYTLGGTATFAPGTKVKFAGDAKVYMVGSDGKLHWMLNQTIAYAIYGASWNKSIVEINNQDLVNMTYGTTITVESDVNEI